MTNGGAFAGFLIFGAAIAYAAMRGGSSLSSSSTSSTGADMVTPIPLNLGAGPDGSDLDTLARTIYGEARGEIGAAEQGVASVIANRANMGPLYGYPGSIAGVCKQRNQFDCWNAGDVNLAKILSVTSADPTFQKCAAVAQGVMDGSLPDDTGGAEFYHDTSIGEPASWQRAGYVRTAQIGHLIFYKRG